MDWQNQNNHPNRNGNDNPYGNETSYPNGNPYGNGNPYNNGNPNGGNLPPYRPVPVRSKGDGMASAALILGIVSIACLFFMQIYVPFITGGIGIVLGILSKGNAKKMLGKAKAGITCCIIGLAADILLCVGSVYLVINLPTLMPEIVDEVNEMCEEQYGFSYDELMEELEDLWSTDGADTYAPESLFH